MRLNHRSYQNELLDKDDIPFDDIKQNMKELDFINTWLGGHAITIAGIRNILGKTDNSGTTISICEIGCGGGNNLVAIDKWATKKGIPVRFIGIDKKKECIDFAREQVKDERYSWICHSYETAEFPGRQPDIIFSSLFCHHFPDEQLVFMLQWMQQNSTLGFFINDLHRNLLAFYSIKLLTRLFSSSYLVKHDAPLSVLRGFRKKEWETILQHSGIKECSIAWKWAFRWLITAK
jgi:2-polyprenyl-3-methyl-5-hydroxy-6-metoxy-1,4-benzoquinol methylase